jgi:hypothetical protein
MPQGMIYMTMELYFVLYRVGLSALKKKVKDDVAISTNTTMVTAKCLLGWNQQLSSSKDVIF